MAGEPIRTTHAGSLPRPDDVVDMIWGQLEGKEVDPRALEERIDVAVAEVVSKQKEVGLDVISDGEMSKTGFSTYVNERFSGFDGRSEFQADDVADFPELAMRLFNTPVDGPRRLLQLRRPGGAVRQGRRASGHRPPQERDRRRRSHVGVHGRDQPGADRVQLSRPALRLARDLPRRLSPTRSPTSTRRSPTPASCSRSTRPTWRWRPTAARWARASATGTRTCRSRSRRSTPRWTGSRASRCACTSAGATTAARTTRMSRSPTSSMTS